MLKHLILITFIWISQASVAAELIRSYFVKPDNTKVMDTIASHFEVVKKLPEGYEVLVLNTQEKEFLKLAPQAVLLQSDIHAQDLFNLSLSDNKYRNFSDVETDLKAYTTKYRGLTHLESYGTSSGGRNLYYLKISTTPESNKPKLLVTAATHGDELITTEVLFRLINELLDGYQKNDRLSKIIENNDLYFIPVVSPDSFEQRERYVNGADPNRSFPWPEKDTNPSRVDVINSLMDLTGKMNFKASLDLHAYGKLVMYPWGYTKTPPPANDVNFFDRLVQSMARENHYTAGQISTTIYIAKGSSADYFYWKHGTQAIAAELGNEKIPSYSQIPSVVNEAREMVWTFLESFN